MAPTVSYTLGNDIISQATHTPSSTNHSPSFLLYDGHGSTRLLTDSSGSITDRMSYDAYGIMLGGNPTASAPAPTSMLYSGEQFDVGLQQQYLRARYYNQAIGAFNRLDPFSGNFFHPQSIHEYAYTHGNPVNLIDPTGLFTLSELLSTTWANFSLKTFIVAGAVGGISNSIINLLIKTKLTHEEVTASSVAEDFALGFIVGGFSSFIGLGVQAAQNLNKLRNIPLSAWRKMLQYIAIPGAIKGIFSTMLLYIKSHVEGTPWSFNQLASSMFFSVVFAIGFDAIGQYFKWEGNLAQESYDEGIELITTIRSQMANHPNRVSAGDTAAYRIALENIPVYEFWIAAGKFVDSALGAGLLNIAEGISKAFAEEDVE